MSHPLRSRARKVQSAFNVTYQQALQLVQRNHAAAAEYVAATGCRIVEADAALLDQQGVARVNRINESGEP